MRFHIQERSEDLFPFRVYDRTRPKWFGRGYKTIEEAQVDCDKRNGKEPNPAPSADDTEQIDDAVNDLLTTIIGDESEEWTGIDIESRTIMAQEIIAKFRKDLASLGIRLTYDTPIGGE